MAYVERWNIQWQPIGQLVTFGISIKEDGYGGGSADIDNYANPPLRIRNRKGLSEFSIGEVIGMEIEVSFWIEPDVTTYDDLFTASARQFRFDVFRDPDGANTPMFVGFMNNANITKPKIEKGPSRIVLSASDGLAYLKKVPWKSLAGANYSGRATFLTQLKRALEHTGHSLDITVKLGIHHLTGALMTAIECALEKADCESQRFYRNEQGILTPLDCSSVITECIGIFNCSIRQLNGVWYIYNNAEVNSYLFTFDWATLTQQSRVAHNPTVVIDSYKFTTKGEVTYRPPLSKVAITFENKYVETSLSINGDFETDVTGWTNGGSPNNWDGILWSSGDQSMLTQLEFPLNDDKDVVSDTFFVDEIEVSDLMLISLQAKVETIAYADDIQLPLLAIEIINTTTAQSVTIGLGRMSEEWKIHDTLSNPPFIMGDGNYTLTLRVLADSNIDVLEVKFDQISFIIQYGTSIVTVDKVITISNDAAIDELTEEYVTRIGDSLVGNDQGGIEIGGTLTSAWRSFGNTEDVFLIDLLGAIQLNARNTHVDYLRLVIIDLADNLDPSTIFSFDSTFYKILRFNKDYMSMITDVDLLKLDQ